MDSKSNLKKIKNRFDTTDSNTLNELSILKKNKYEFQTPESICGEIVYNTPLMYLESMKKGNETNVYLCIGGDIIYSGVLGLVDKYTFQPWEPSAWDSFGSKWMETFMDMKWVRVEDVRYITSMLEEDIQRNLKEN